MSRNNVDFWRKRVKEYGHTGWANPAIYAFDQPIRVGIVDKLIRKHRSSDGGVLLDFGCGSGDFAVNLESQFEKVVLYDICEDVLNIAKSRINNSRLFNTLDELLMSDTEYTCIISITVLQHIMDNDELERIIRFFYERLQNDGIVVVMEQFHNNNVEYIRSWKFEDLNKIFENNGFCAVDRYDFYENGIFKDPVFDKFRHKPTIFFLYHLHAYFRFLRKIIEPMIVWITKRGRYAEDVERYLFPYSNNEGDKFMVYKKESKAKTIGEK